MVDLDSHVLRNRRVWDRLAREYAEPGRRLWSSAEPAWGIWNIPESKANVLPGAAGRDVLELGCGTGYVSAWLARRGGRPVGLDNSRVQLTTARRLQQDFGLAFPLVQADAERVPLADACFDVVISEYGASIWCDPYRWIPEVSRLLRPGGELVFLVNGAILMLCAPDEEGRPATDRLLRPYFGMLRCEGPQDESVDFHLGHGDPSEALPETLAGPWPSEREYIRLLRTNGFEVEDLLELRSPEGSTTRYDFVTLGWAQRWPSEEVWKARKRAPGGQA